MKTHTVPWTSIVIKANSYTLTHSPALTDNLLNSILVNAVMKLFSLWGCIVPLNVCYKKIHLISNVWLSDQHNFVSE